MASFNNDDWISSIDSINPTSKIVTSSQLSISQPKILSGSYDGIVRTYNMSGKVEKQYVGHSAPVKAVNGYHQQELSLQVTIDKLDYGRLHTRK